MSLPDLNISIAASSAAEIRGQVADDACAHDWVRVGADVTIHVNPPQTTFADPAILGSGRIYDDHIEIDLVMAPDDAAALTKSLEGREAARLGLTTRALTETIFRIEGLVQT